MLGTCANNTLLRSKVGGFGLVSLFYDTAFKKIPRMVTWWLYCTSGAPASGKKFRSFEILSSSDIVLTSQSSGKDKTVLALESRKGPLHSSVKIPIIKNKHLTCYEIKECLSFSPF